MATIDPETISNAATAGEAAAMWWISALQDPKLDNGDDGPTMSWLIAMSRELNPPQPTEGLGQFGVVLAKQVNQLLDSDRLDAYTAHYGIRLNVDYTPDGLLLECAEQASLRCDVGDWPWKTSMQVKPDKVSVWHGYTAKEEIIWQR